MQERLAREKRERQWQTWLSALDKDRQRAEAAALTNPWAWVPDDEDDPKVKKRAANPHMAYFLRTGKKFMDFQDALFVIQDRLFPTVQPGSRCQKCRDKKTPGRKLSMKRIMIPDASPLPLPLA